MEGYVTTQTVHTKYWSKTLEGIYEYIHTFRGVNGMPLSYVLRKQLVPTAEADDSSNGYNTINDEMIARYPIVVAGTVGNTAAL